MRARFLKFDKIKKCKNKINVCKFFFVVNYYQSIAKVILFSYKNFTQLYQKLKQNLLINFNQLFSS